MTNPRFAKLGPDEAHVWYLFPPSFPPHLEEEALALLSCAERARHARFHFAEGRREYLLTRILARTTLSRYVDLEPAGWRFRAGPLGRPEIDPSLGVPLSFNLSHTEGLIACIVGLQRELGIDVESIRPERATLALAARNLSPAEAVALRDLPSPLRPARFFDLWTLKEAYLKARGVGVRLPLEQLSFEIAPEEVIASFGPGINDGPQAWQFDRLGPSAAHRVSTALRRGRTAKVRIAERTVCYGLSCALNSPASCDTAGSRIIVK